MSDWAVTGQQQKLQVAELALMEKQVEVCGVVPHQERLCDM
jgi:hypothetical protein